VFLAALRLQSVFLAMIWLQNLRSRHLACSKSSLMPVRLRQFYGCERGKDMLVTTTIVVTTLTLPFWQFYALSRCR
jgi:hypothetical protein